jgi:hypothetical protein
MYITSQQRFILTFTPAMESYGAENKARLGSPWAKSNSALPHRSNFAILGLLLMIPDERGTISGHDVPFFLQHSNSERHRENGHKDRLTFVLF